MVETCVTAWRVLAGDFVGWLPVTVIVTATEREVPLGLFRQKHVPVTYRRESVCCVRVESGSCQ